MGVYVKEKTKQKQTQADLHDTKAGLRRGYGMGGGGRHRRLRSEARAWEKVRVSALGQGSPVATGLPTWFSK